MSQYIKFTGNSWHAEFPDVQQFIEACHRPTTRSEHDCASMRTTDKEWYGGCGTWADAEKLLAEGDPALESTVRSMAQEVSDIVGLFVPAMRMQYAEVGEMVDIGMYLTGEPACMMYAEETTRPGSRIVRMAYNPCCSGSTDARSMTLKGAAFCVLIDALERSGYRADVVMDYAVGGGYGHTGRIICPIKAAGEALDMARVAYLIAHPASFRRHIFHFQETLPESIITTFRFTNGGGYGHVTDPPIGDYDVWMPSQAPFYTADNARQWVKRQMEKFTQSA